MYLERLITDRSQQDLINDTDKAYISYEDLNRVYGACKELADLLHVSVHTKTWVPNEFRTQQEMVRLRENLITLKNAYYETKAPSIPESIKYENIYEANDIELIIKMIWQLYKDVQNGLGRLSMTLGRPRIGNGVS